MKLIAQNLSFPKILLDYCKITVIISNNYVHDHCEQKSAVT